MTKGKRLDSSEKKKKKKSNKPVNAYIQREPQYWHNGHSLMKLQRVQSSKEKSAIKWE